jgi:hypothetical protein
MRVMCSMVRAVGEAARTILMKVFMTNNRWAFVEAESEQGKLKCNAY